MEPTERLPSHHGRMLNLEPTERLPSHHGRMLNLEPTERLPSYHGRMLNLRKDKTTGLVESVGPGRIRADGKATITPSENPELINPVE